MSKATNWADFFLTLPTIADGNRAIKDLVEATDFGAKTVEERLAAFHGCHDISLDGSVDGRIRLSSEWPTTTGMIMVRY
eukprot:scaffold62360_cov39-Attheya_sp.AAC.2